MSAMAINLCPSWCVRHVVDIDGSTLHYAPAVGPFSFTAGTEAGGATYEALAAAFYDRPDGMTSADLRQLAGDALAAADWMEANA